MFCPQSKYFALCILQRTTGVRTLRGCSSHPYAFMEMTVPKSESSHRIAQKFSSNSSLSITKSHSVQFALLASLITQFSTTQKCLSRVFFHLPNQPNKLAKFNHFPSFSSLVTSFCSRRVPKHRCVYWWMNNLAYY